MNERNGDEVVEGAWVAVLGQDEVPAGEMAGIEIGDDRIAVYNIEGALYATSNVCTHGFAMLTEGWLEGCEIECPLHGGRFDVTTGKVTLEPAECDLRTYPVRVVDGRIEVLLEG